MRLHSDIVGKKHEELYESYKKRLAEIEAEDKNNEEEDNAPFERSFLHNAIYLHNLWFEQLEDTAEETSSALLEEILEQRESDIQTFQTWMGNIAKDAKPNGWAVWAWSYAQKTFVGFPMLGHDEGVPVGVLPILVVDCWEHSYIEDYGNDFDQYLVDVWQALNWSKIETRHQELASMLGFNIK